MLQSIFASLTPTQTWCIIGIVGYILIWIICVKLLRLMQPQSESEWEEYTEEHGIPYINISDMVVGIAAIWIVWLVLGIIYLVYVILAAVWSFIVSLFR